MARTQITTTVIKPGTLEASSNWSFAGSTIVSLGTVTTGTFTAASILGGTLDNAVIGANTAAAGSFAALVGTSLNVSEGNITNVGDIALDTISADGSSFTFSDDWTNAGNTVADLGTVTTVDINGGAIDGATIGASSATTGKFTTVSGSGAGSFGSLTLDGALALQSAGVTAAGSLAGVTTLVASSTVSGSGAASFGSLTLDGALALQSAGITAAGAIAGATTISGTLGLSGNQLTIGGGYGLSKNGALGIASMSSNWTNAGRTVADAGILTTVDINGGTVDATIGGTTPASGAFTTLYTSGQAQVAGALLMDKASISDAGAVSGALGLSGNQLTIGGGYGLSKNGALGIASMSSNWTNSGRTVADLGTVTTVDINGGTIDGATIATSDVTVGAGKTLTVSAGTLTTSAAQNLAIMQGASANVDIGAYDLRASTMTADSLTSGRVPFASTAGLLVDDSDFTFATDTLTVTKLGAYEQAGSVDFSDEAMTNVNIDSGAIDGTAIGANSATTGKFTTVSGSGAASFGSLTLDGALALQSAGVTAAGSLAGVTTLVASSTVSGSGAASFGSLTLDGALALQSAGITAAGAIAGATTINASGVATVGALTVGSADVVEADLEVIDGMGSSTGTALASKAVVLDGSKDVSGINALGIASMASNWTNASRTVANLGTVTTGTFTAASILGGTLDNAVIGANTAAAGSFTTVTASTSATAASLALASGATVTAILDEDAMGSDSATALATQQSIKAYVDSVAQGLDLKESCVAATTATLDAGYNNGSSGVGATLTASGSGALSIDGITPSVSDRVLVKDETHAAFNGIYTVTNAGSGGAAFILTRATDFNTSAKMDKGSFTFVEKGSAAADSGFVMTQDSTITVGTTDIDWTQFSGAGSISAGTGLSKSGDTLSLNLGGLSAVTPVVSADSVAIVDASDSNASKSVTMSNFAGALVNGTTGLTSASGVISLNLSWNEVATDLGAQTAYSLSAPGASGDANIMVFVNGLLQRRGVGQDYVYDADGNGGNGLITFATANSATDVVIATYQQ